MVHDASALVICEHCDAVYRRRVLACGERARCLRCGAILYRHQRLGARSVLALSIAGLVVWIMANSWPIVTMSVNGVSSSATLWGAVATAWHDHVQVVAVLVAATLFFAPLWQLLLLIWACGFAAMGRRPPGVIPIVRVLRWLHPWSMIEVLMLGILVATVKLHSMLEVTPGVGLWGFAALMVLITVVSSWDTRGLWQWSTRRRA